MKKYICDFSIIHILIIENQVRYSLPPEKGKYFPDGKRRKIDMSMAHKNLYRIMPV